MSQGEKKQQTNNNKTRNIGAAFEESESVFQALVINKRRLCAAVHTQDLDLLLPQEEGAEQQQEGEEEDKKEREREEEITNITATSASSLPFFMPCGTLSNDYFLQFITVDWTPTAFLVFLSETENKKCYLSLPWEHLGPVSSSSHLLHWGPKSFRSSGKPQGGNGGKHTDGVFFFYVGGGRVVRRER